MVNPNDFSELCIYNEEYKFKDLNFCTGLFDFCDDCGWCWFTLEEKRLINKMRDEESGVV